MTTGMPDFGALMAQAQQIQQQMMQAQEGLAELQAVGTSGGGLVSATVDGRGDLLDLRIEAAAYDPSDPDALDTLADLVVAAVRDAKTEAEQAASERMSDAGGGIAALGESLGGSLGGSLESLLPPGLLGPPQNEVSEADEPSEDR